MALDKKRKKELLTQYKQQESADARRKMCLQLDQLRDLRNYLASTIEQLGIPCDHTLARTREWALLERLNPDEVLKSVREFGGYCDCEVLYNVTPDKFGWD